jgi:hypothetical protein
MRSRVRSENARNSKWTWILPTPYMRPREYIINVRLLGEKERLRDRCGERQGEMGRHQPGDRLWMPPGFGGGGV